MEWIMLTGTEQLEEIDVISETKPAIIFKHSTRCGISAGALGRIERNYRDTDGKQNTWYYLDLLKYRSVSDAIAQRYGIVHESPQILVIRNGRCTYEASHFDIRYEEVMEHLNHSR